MIRLERPPNWDSVIKAFPHAATLPTLFAYGEDIYNPSGVHIPAALIAHEYRHCARQFTVGTEAWWAQYLTDDEFRYTEELLAHVEEYRVQAAGLKDRNARAKLSMRTASRLVAPLYNYQPPRTIRQAQRDLESYV